MGFRVDPDFKKPIEIMVPAVKNAPYGRLALVGCDVNPVSWEIHAKKYGELCMFSASLVFFFQNVRKRLIPIAPTILMIQSTILPLATSTLTILK